jgi:hypothetical protein
MGDDFEPWFVPMKYVCKASEDTECLCCMIYYSNYKVNSLDAGWIGPHTTYPYYLLLYVGVANHCVPFTLIS